MAAELKAGEQQMALRQVGRLLLVRAGDAGSEDDRRQLQLQQRLPVPLVHLENNLLDNLKCFVVFKTESLVKRSKRYPTGVKSSQKARLYG